MKILLKGSAFDGRTMDIDDDAHRYGLVRIEGPERPASGSFYGGHIPASVARKTRQYKDTSLLAKDGTPIYEIIEDDK